MDTKPEIWLLAAGRRYSFVERLIKAGFDVVAFEDSRNPPIADLCHIVSCNTRSYESQSYYLAECLSFRQEKEPFRKRLILPMSDAWSGAYLDILEALNYYNLSVPIVGSMDNYYCYNKKELQNKLLDSAECQQYYPKFSWLHDAVSKPIYGCASKGIQYIPFYGMVRKLFRSGYQSSILQRRIYGSEYSVDAYFCRHHRYINGVVRSRDRVDGGEVVNSRVIDSGYTKNDILAATRIIGNYLGLVGPTCFQFIYAYDHKTPYLLEINARFGGGSILSLEAGFDMIQMIKDEYVDNKELDLTKWEQFSPKYIEMKRVYRETFRT